jgi:hypothetical protein
VLPEALSLDESSGCLTGTPKQIVTKCKYTLKAYNQSGQCSTDFWLQIVDQTAPSNFSYTLPPLVHTRATAAVGSPQNGCVLVIVGDPPLQIKVAQAFNAGLPAATFRVTPPLPQGMSIAADTGTIFGAASRKAPLCRYKVTAQNSKDFCEFDFHLEVQVHVPPSAIQYVYQGSALSGHAQLYSLFAAGTDVCIAPLAVAQKGTHLEFSVSPALPQGLQLSRETGVISGTVREVCPQTAYNIRARNKRGDASTTIQFATVQDHKCVPLEQWTTDMVRVWLKEVLKFTDSDLLEFLGVDGPALLAEPAKRLISAKV